MTEKTSSKVGKARATAFTAEERAAMKERASELKAGASREEGEQAILAKLAEMPPADRALGERLHRIISAAAPTLMPKLWYGMPAYARSDRIVCFYQNAGKFKARYGTLGFSDAAHLDDGTMWPTSYALTELTEDDEARIAELVRRAVG